MRLEVINIDQIEVGQRFREELGDIEELAHDIKERGLITPLAVRHQPTAEKPYLLLAGGRRLAALILNQTTQVAVRVFDSEFSNLDEDNTQLLTRGIELSENYHRKDFTFREQTRLSREIHEIHCRIFGEKVSGSQSTTGWTMEKTAEMIGKDKSSVSKDIKIANALDTFPELFKGCNTKTDASKVMTQLGEHLIRAELAKRFNQSAPMEHKRLAESFILGDFFEEIKKLPESCVNFVEIDPPYAIDLKTKRKVTSASRIMDGYNEIDQEDYPQFLQNLFTSCYRVMSINSWLVFWFPIHPWYSAIITIATNCGFEVNPNPCLWIKDRAQANVPETKLPLGYETFLYMRKGQATLVKQGRLSYFQYPTLQSTQRIHPTERPVPLIVDILKTFAFEGSRVLVPFLGSGNTLLAAKECKMTAFGYEKTEAYRNGFLARLTNLVENFNEVKK